MQLECLVLPADVRGSVVTSRRCPRGVSGIACIGAILTSLAGCTPGPITHPAVAAPMNHPVAMSSTPGSGAIESARRALLGTWELAALELAPSGDGARVPVIASGTLTYDEFGNLTIDAHMVVIEGYSFGSGHRAHNMGELGGVVRLALFEKGRVLAVVPPSSRAKYATGKGNAPKEQVLAEAIRRLKYEGHDNNEADAMWLLAMAADQYDAPYRVVVPAGHRVALKSIEWPRLDKQSK